MASKIVLKLIAFFFISHLSVAQLVKLYELLYHPCCGDWWTATRKTIGSLLSALSRIKNSTQHFHIHCAVLVDEFFNDLLLRYINYFPVLKQLRSREKERRRPYAITSPPSYLASLISQNSASWGISTYLLVYNAYFYRRIWVLVVGKVRWLDFRYRNFRWVYNVLAFDAKVLN